MSDKTAIEWTDATWNPIIGCSVVSPGCTNCYAMRLAGTRLKNHPSRQGLTIETKAGPVWNGQVRLIEEHLKDPLRWTRPRRIFVCAHADLFADAVPDAWIDKIYAVMVWSQQHTFQILTKRPERMRAVLQRIGKYVADWWAEVAEADHSCASAGLAFQAAFPAIYEAMTVMRARKRQRWTQWPLPNVQLGVSVEDQARAEERIPILMSTPAAVRWISAEPLLGPIDLTALDIDGDAEMDALAPYSSVQAREDWGDEDAVGHPALDWVVVGGESGPGSRPMHPDWPRQIRDACAAAGVPFLFKQWGNWWPIGQMPADAADDLYHPPPKSNPEGRRRCKVANTVQHLDGSRHDHPSFDAYAAGSGAMLTFEVGKKAAGRRLDGVEHNAMPVSS